jgi:hypothetical protein
MDEQRFGDFAVEPEPYLRNLAEQSASPRFEVVDGVPEQLPACNEQFDAAVVSLGRDTVAAAEETGFRIDDVDRFSYPETQVPWPAASNVLVHATRTT